MKMEPLVYSKGAARVKCTEAVKELGKRKMETKGVDGTSNQLCEYEQRAE